MTVVDVTIDGKAAKIFLPAGYSSANYYPLVLAFNGNGKNAAAYVTDVNEMGFVDIATDVGYILAVVTTDADTFGSDVTVQRNKALYDYVQANYSVYKKVILWGYSAGGSMAQNFIRYYSGLVAGVVGLFPVYDFANTSAGGVPAGASAFNPKNFNNYVFGKKFAIIHGDTDTVVPHTTNSVAFKNDIRPYGGFVDLLIQVGKGHDQDAAYTTGANRLFFEKYLALFLSEILINSSVIPKRGSTTQHNTYTGSQGELTVDMTEWNLRVHDGKKAGGFRLQKKLLSFSAAKTASFTISLTDHQDILDIDSATDVVLTVPTNAAVAFDIGYRIRGFQLNTGAVTITPSGGVTVLAPNNRTKTAYRYSQFELIKKGTNTWILSGDII